ncbi:hypothetical protein M0804_005700 [Polistes exclamans]|nr:hypothetical protein M0804_005700 [Polistes exclamans]
MRTLNVKALQRDSTWRAISPTHYGCTCTQPKERLQTAKKSYRRNDVDDDAAVLVDDNDVVGEKTKRKTEEGAMVVAVAVAVAVVVAATAVAATAVAATAVAMKEERRRELSEDDGLN